MCGPEGCPECGALGAVTLLVKRDRLVKRCSACEHRWNEEREPELIRPGGWVSREEGRP